MCSLLAQPQPGLSAEGDYMTGDRVEIEVGLMEFVEGGHTIWIHSPEGGTVLRIKCSGKITVDAACRNNVAHSDIMVDGDIEICVPEKTPCQS